ncbi:MAG TPA: Hsp20/alpha crystallin family protein [Candidatus Hydrogenedentes bacterium]|nr:Hsp20/alpha crystallin family protein [Candidatus Hydrogenedentota bacterium]HPG66046.1 Hsp20/alpha crystallin family protein [Candidatus Hydrogenedentota bacterium]
MKESTLPEKSDVKAPATREESRTLVPPVDIFETSDALVVIADLPGVAKETVEVHVENDVLTIKGGTKTSEKGDMLRREFELRDYFRQFELGEQIDQEKIRADMKTGVLTIHLPKVEKVKPKKIDVKVEK